MTADVPYEEPPPLRRAIGRIIRGVEPGPQGRGYSNELLAGMRRLTRQAPEGKALFTVLWQDVEPLGLEISAEDEVSWAVLLCALANNARFHNGRERMGAALARAGFSELRFERLLRSPDQMRLLDQVRAAGQYLASKGALADWSEMAEMLNLDHVSDDVLEGRRRRMARDYYRTLHNLTHA